MTEQRTAKRRRKARTGPGKGLKPVASVKVPCAFCKGSGKDPFGVMSHLSTCQVCGGRGEVRVREPAVPCKFCQGSGVEPYSSSRLTCSACKGKGMVTGIENGVPCPVCGGDGVHPVTRTMAFFCQKCKGKGVLPKRAKAGNPRAKRTSSKPKSKPK